jgi:hypothetical protein
LTSKLLYVLPQTDYNLSLSLSVKMGCSGKEHEEEEVLLRESEMMPF